MNIFMVCISNFQCTFILHAGCTNEFVEVDIDLTTSSLTCLFQNNQNTAEKTCSVEYSLCTHQGLVFSTEGNNTLEIPDRVTLKLNLTTGSNCYTYTVRASDGINTIVVEGRINPGEK